jgi:hypothetical protein
MIDYSELLGRLYLERNTLSRKAATAIETLTRELSEARVELQAIVANWEIEQSIWQTDIDRIKRTLGGQSDVMDYVKSLRAELTDTKARLAEAVEDRDTHARALTRLLCGEDAIAKQEAGQ